MSILLILSLKIHIFIKQLKCHKLVFNTCYRNLLCKILILKLEKTIENSRSFSMIVWK